ncbi:hypothetical protein PFDG_05309 [Plasmodium falciparum Dd2]|uniref:Uncharacterized protein n=1 Tax=Plasmodium falciparum (isolate Dd2) TaxID=57267 RepID=A0A0L7MAY8_PLAF4|nr:hypothetical protein PFDG_05309 [Plasmodium falciparum Dd2]
MYPPCGEYNKLNLQILNITDLDILENRTDINDIFNNSLSETNKSANDAPTNNNNNANIHNRYS